MLLNISWRKNISVGEKMLLALMKGEVIRGRMCIV